MWTPVFYHTVTKHAHNHAMLFLYSFVTFSMWCCILVKEQILPDSYYQQPNIWPRFRYIVNQVSFSFYFFHYNYQYAFSGILALQKKRYILTNGRNKLIVLKQKPHFHASNVAYWLKLLINYKNVSNHTSVSFWKEAHVNDTILYPLLVIILQLY